MYKSNASEIDGAVLLIKADIRYLYDLGRKLEAQGNKNAVNDIKDIIGGLETAISSIHQAIENEKMDVGR